MNRICIEYALTFRKFMYEVEHSGAFLKLLRCLSIGLFSSQPLTHIELHLMYEYITIHDLPRLTSV